MITYRDTNSTPEPVSGRYSVGKIAYYLASTLSLGLPQTLKHAKRVWDDMNLHYRQGRREDEKLDMVDMTVTLTAICLQAGLVYETYSRVLEKILQKV